MKLFDIELTDKEFDLLMCEQAKGKELKVENGKVIAYIREATKEELKEQKIAELKHWFSNYFDYQFRQSLWQTDYAPTHDDYFGKDYADIEELKAQAEIVRAEIKELQGDK